MKRVLTVLFLLIIICAACFAVDLGTQTIVVTYVVSPIQPEFAIRNAQTGETGKSVIYSTDSIAKNDVSTDFQIIQSNNCNYIGEIEVSICATELSAVVNGTRYQTEGVDIRMDGTSYGQKASVNLSYCGVVKMNALVGNFQVTWPTSKGLANATYQAVISLNCTAK